MEGYGTDSYVYLKVDSGDAQEVLPDFNSVAEKHYNEPTLFTANFMKFPKTKFAV